MILTAHKATSYAGPKFILILPGRLFLVGRKLGASIVKPRHHNIVSKIQVTAAFETKNTNTLCYTNTSHSQHGMCGLTPGSSSNVLLK